MEGVDSPRLDQRCRVVTSNDGFGRLDPGFGPLAGVRVNRPYFKPVSIVNSKFNHDLKTANEKMNETIDKSTPARPARNVIHWPLALDVESLHPDYASAR